MKDFLYSDIVEPTPYELIEQDIMLYGKDYWRSLDKMDFFMRYGMTKDYFRENYLLLDSVSVFTEFTKPFTEHSLKDMIEGLKNEGLSHNSSTKVARAEVSQAKSPKENVPQQAVSETLQKPSKPAQQNASKAQSSKKKSIKSVEYTPSTQKNDAASLAKQSFQNYKKALIRRARGKFGKKAISLATKALVREIKEQGIQWGTKAWVSLVQKYFPGTPFSAIVQEQSNNNNQFEEQIDETSKLQEDTKEKKQENKQKENNAEEESVKENDKTGGDSKDSSKEDTKKEAPDLSAENSQEYVTKAKNDTLTQFIERVRNSSDEVAELQIKEKEAEKEALPELENPTGIEAKTESQKQQETELKAKRINPDSLAEKSSVEVKTEGNKVSGKEVVERFGSEYKLTEGPLINLNLPQTATNEETGDAAEIKDSISSMTASDSELSTSPGETPQFKLEGETDKSQNDQNREKADADIDKGLENAGEAVNQNFGESFIAPETEPEILKPEIEFSEVKEQTAAELNELQNIPPEIEEAFDMNAKAHLDEQTSAEIDRANQSKEEFDSKAEDEKNTTLQQIDQETKATEQQQLEAKQQTQDEVAAHKEQWESENQTEIQTYRDQSEAEYDRVSQDIDTKVSETNTETERKYTEAERDAEAERLRAEKEAQDKKDEADKKDRGFWGRLTDAVSGFFNKIKEGINAIFDGLRKLVKNIIDAAKKAVSALIDLARDAIVGMIKAFGSILKGIVSIVFAAFPKLAKKFNDLIDKAINKAVEIVNVLAEGLKNAVCALLDVLGKVIDTFLAAYQAVINAILDVLEFIAVGIIKILEGLANLGIALFKAVAEYFVGAMVEEALGTDVTKPINVERTDAEIAAHEGGTMPAEQEAGASGISPDEEQQNQEVLNKGELSDSDVELPEGPAEITPELLRNLPPINIGQSIPLGENSNPITREQLQAAFSSGGENVDGIADSIADSITADAQAEGQMENIAEQADPDWATMSDDDKLDYYLNQMNTEPAAPEGQQTGTAEQQNSEGVDTPYIAKTGRLSIGQRLSFVGQQMLNGMKMWWQKNQAKIYAAIIGILIGAGVIAFFTGGAGLIAVLQILMQVMTAYFIADAIIRIKGHFYSYLEKSWGGDTVGGGKNMAKALAILVSEFVLEYLLKVVGKVLKRIKAALKGTKKVGKVMQGVSQVAKKVGSGFKSVGRKIKTVVLTKGRFIFTKLNKAWLKVVNTIGDLRQKILKKFGFKRVWMEKSGKYIELWADFNPKILLMRTDADGEKIEFSTRNVDTPDRKILGGVDDIYSGSRKEVGRSLSANEIIVSDSFADTFKKMDPVDQQRIYKELQNMEPDEIRKLCGGSNPPAWLDDPDIPQSVKEVYYKRGDLNRKLDTPKGQNAHHVNTIESLGNNKVLQDAVDNGFPYNDIDNGINLDRYSSNIDTPNASPYGTHASHPSYAKSVDKVHAKFEEDFINTGNYNPKTDSKIYTEVFTEKLKLKLEVHCSPKIDAASRIKVDNLFDHIDINNFYDEVIIEFYKRKK